MLQQSEFLPVLELVHIEITMHYYCTKVANQQISAGNSVNTNYITSSISRFHIKLSLKVGKVEPFHVRCSVCIANINTYSICVTHHMENNGIEGSIQK